MSSVDNPDSEESKRELAIHYGFIDSLPPEYRFKLIFDNNIFLNGNEWIYVSENKHWMLEIVYPNYIFSFLGIFFNWDYLKPRCWLCINDNLATVLQITIYQDLQARWQFDLYPRTARNTHFDLADPASCDGILKLLKRT